MSQPKINDFVIKFANVNGSGSASANQLFAKAILRMGVPVGPRNIFPSNIQGLPTWYEVRVSEAGYLGARGGVDLMVAMNPQTWDKDLLGIEPGGYLFYDSTKALPPSRFREDINVIGVPLTELCNREYSDPRQRQLFRNMVYVGALGALLAIDIAEMEKLIREQFSGKDSLIAPNIQALHLGHAYASEHFECPISLQVRRCDQVGERILTTHGGRLVAGDAVNALEQELLAALDAYHASEPLRPGMPTGTLRGRLPANVPAEVCELAIERLAAAGAIAIAADHVRATGHTVALDPQSEALAGRIVERLASAGLEAPSLRELMRKAG